MRYGICTTMDNLQLLTSTGYDYIELNVTRTLDAGEEALARWRDELKASTVKAETASVLFPKTMNLVDGSVTEAELDEYLERAMSVMSSLGVELVVFGSGKCRTCPPSLDYAKAYDRLVRVCRRTGEVAQQHGIEVAIEPLSRAETNMICTMAEGAILARDVDHPAVGLLSDYYHVMTNHDAIDDIRVIKHFRHIHVAAAAGRKYPLTAQGECYDELMGALISVGYDGRISIEGKTEDMAKDAMAALRFLKECEKRARERG